MSSVKLYLLSTATCLFLFAGMVFGQTKPEPSGEAQDVIKFDTSLVQTDVMVFDKKGRFVDGLRPEQFQLKVNNTDREISFFEIIKSGGFTSHREELKSTEPTPVKPPVNPPKPDAPRRAVIFFVDDLHLAPDSLARTRTSLLDFIDRGIGDKDLVAITSPSGQIGFLQQFTADKEALRSAVARLNYRTQTKLDMEKPPMSEYIALKIREGDPQMISYYIQEMLKQNCFFATGSRDPICTVSPQSAKQLVQQRAQQMVVESAPATDNTLRLLEGLMRTAAQLPGRKLVFVISDGFYLNDRKTGAIDRIKKVTDAAGRAGVVIYTLDARGIVSDSIDITNNKPIEAGGLLTGATLGEISASQDGLNALAKDTGGQAFRNTNQPMHKWVEKVIDETSSYYLLAWKPDTEEQKRGKFKNIEVSIAGRPELKVRARTSYFKTAALPLLTTKRKRDKDPAKARDDDMRLVIDAPVSQREIPTEVDLRFNQMPGFGTRVIVTVSIEDAALTFEPIDGKLAADVDIGGILYDDKGKPIDSFVGRLRIFPRSSNATTTSDPATQQKRSIYRFSAMVPGGLYQVRVGIRDLKSSRLGSAMDWIKVPKI